MFEITTLNPLLFLFGVSPERLALAKGGQKLIAFSTLLAQHLTLLKWKEVAPHTVSHWIKDVLFHVKLEKIKLVTKGSERRLTDLEAFPNLL